ncbi:hypothetical protein ACFE33_09830 [Falsihalocynthiibacter sp. SS001]|uniref:DUF7742 family protein n=1 Tax=Falsihalocynthiibacter sp. SS001 TaxID=3349698 RepID=UPI0036D2E562
MSSAACALLKLPEEARAGAFDEMLMQAEAADKYRKVTGRAHPRWGNGSLMAVARTHPIAREPFLDHLEYCAILAMIFERLLEWRIAQRARGGHIKI